MESKKRERSSNFNSVETQLLVSLVDRHKKIIENKKTDAVTNKDKEFAWRKIENTFNSCGVTTSVRSWKTLKLKYEGIKKSTKKKSSQQRQEMYRTGGGPSNAPTFNDVEEKVLSICSNMKGLEARHDSDTIAIPSHVGEVFWLDSLEINTTDMVEQNKPTQTHELKITRDQELCIAEAQEPNITHIEETNKIPDLDESVIPDKNEDNETQKENKWKRWNPNTLRTRVSNVLKTDTVSKASVTVKLDKLSTARLELVQLQIETAKKEQKFLEEQHNLKMIHLANDENRKQEIHRLLIEKLNGEPVNGFQNFN